MRRWILASMLFVSACTSGTWKDFYGDTRSATIPREVRDFVIDAQGCGHFSGEKPYDAERAAFLKKNIGELCVDLEQRHKKLAARYASNPEASVSLKEAWNVFQ